MAECLAQMHSIMDARVTTRHFGGLGRGHYLRPVDGPDAGEIGLHVFYDDGTRHQLIEVELLPGFAVDAAMAELTAVSSTPAKNGPSRNGFSDSRRGDPRRAPMPVSSTNGSLPKRSIGPRVHEAYLLLAGHYGLPNQGHVPADDYAEVLGKKFPESTVHYYAQRLRRAKLIVDMEGHKHLIEAQIEIIERGGRRRMAGASPAPVPTRVAAQKPPPSTTRPSIPGPSDHAALLGYLTRHAELIRSVGLLGRTERIGETIVRAEELLGRLDKNLRVVDGQDGFAIKLRRATTSPKRPPTKRRGRMAKPKRR